jgi:hypothetical protein
MQVFPPYRRGEGYVKQLSPVTLAEAVRCEE